MPGSADISGLNVQFGALDFGSEAGSGTVDMAQMELAREQAPAQAPAPAPLSVPTAVPTQQPQSSLFSKPGTVRCVWDVLSCLAHRFFCLFEEFFIYKFVRQLLLCSAWNPGNRFLHGPTVQDGAMQKAVRCCHGENKFVNYLKEWRELCNFSSVTDTNWLHHILYVYLYSPSTFLGLVNSEHMSSLPSLPSAVSDPSFPSPSLGLPSATPSPSLGLPSAAAPPSSAAPTAASRVESSSGPRSLPPHLGFSQSKDVTSAAGGPLTVRINLFSLCMHRGSKYQKKDVDNCWLQQLLQSSLSFIIPDKKLNDKT